MKISVKMMEAILYMFDNREIMLERLQDRWGRSKVQAALDRLYLPVEDDRELPDDLNDVEKDVMREAVEGTIWLRPYISCGRPGELEEARSTLRDLSKLLEPLGVEINHIPNA